MIIPALLTPAAQADEDDDAPAPTTASLRATLLYDGLDAETATAIEAASGRRSVPVAFGLSAVVPGLGQAYNRQWVKAAVGLAAEAALIIGYTTWRGRGLDGRDAYQAYAHQFWSPMRYANWLNDYKQWLEAEFNTPIGAPDIQLPPELAAIDFTNPDGWSSAQWALVRDLINQIRDVETSVYHPETGASFSHRLPGFGEQQYYELVGKYFQFAPGWVDYPAYVGGDGSYLDTIDPEKTGPDGSKPNVSDRFFDYARDHGQANDYLRRASRMSVLFIANHFIAAVDAAVFAKLHNDRVQTRLEMSFGAYGEPQPGARLTVRL